jgi:hypothetical protein
VANFVGLGIATCKGNAGLDGKNYGRDWKMKTKGQLNDVWKRVSRLMETGGTNGLYMASLELLGKKGTERLLKQNEHMTAPRGRDMAVLMNDTDMLKLTR